MRRLAWLTVMATARAAPATDTLLARAAALARWVNRTGPAPPSWTVTSPRDVTVGHEVHAGKIKKVSRGTTKADLGGSSIIIKTIEHGENGTLLMELLFLHSLRGAPGVPDLYGAWFDDDRVTYVVGDGGEPIARKKGPRRSAVVRGARGGDRSSRRWRNCELTMGMWSRSPRVLRSCVGFDLEASASRSASRAPRLGIASGL